MRHLPRLLLPLGLLVAAAGGARAELPQPACEDLAQWVQGHERNEGWSPNSLGGRPRFSAIFAEPPTAALFGKPVLDWTPEEARGIAAHLGACGQTLRRAGNREAAGALARLRIHAQREVPAYLDQLAEARAAVPRLLAALGTEAPSAPLLRFHLALAETGAQPEAAPQANQAIRGLGGPARTAARDLLNALRHVPQAEFAALLAPAAERVPALRAGLRDALIAAAETVPASFAGLQALERQARALPEQAAALGEAAAAEVEAAFAARREAIGAGLRDDLLAQVEAVSANPAGAYRLEQLRQQAAQQYAPAIGPDGMRAVEAAIAARREAVAGAIVEEVLGGIQRLSATPAALRTLHDLETQPANAAVFGLIGQDGLRRVREAAVARRSALGVELAAAMRRDIAEVPSALEGFATLDRIAPAGAIALLPREVAEAVTVAAAARRAKIAAAALPAFRAELARLPETEESVAVIDGAVLGGIAAWPDSAADEKTRFAALAQERRAAILAAVDRAEAGPLRGRIYEGERMSLEFLDRTRVVVTEPGEPPEAGTYAEEPDGRVIVSTGGRSIVMTREGRRLIAGPIEARRVK